MSLPRRFAPYYATGTLEAIDTHGSLPKALLKTYAAFANTQGGAIVIGAVLGPDGSLAPTGLTDPFATIRALWRMLNDPAQVSANILVNANIRLEKLDERDVVAVYVPQARGELKPIHLGRRAVGRTYLRIDGQTLACSEEAVHAMERAARPIRDALPLDDVPLSAMNLDTIGAFHDALRRVRPHHPWLGLDTPEEFLMRLGAIGRGGRSHLLHPTQAGLLLFGCEEEITSELPFYSLRFEEAEDAPQGPATVFASDDGTWSGNVFDFWLHACARIDAWASSAPADRPVGAPALSAAAQARPAVPSAEEGPSVLARAAREVVANALAHADYRGRGGVSIACTAEGICAESPGRLPAEEGVTQQGGLIAPRNPTLKGMLELVGVGRPQGGGITALQEACRQQAGLHLELSESCDPERTTLALTLRTPQARSLRTCRLRRAPRREAALPEAEAGAA